MKYDKKLVKNSSNCALKFAFCFCVLKHCLSLLISSTWMLINNSLHLPLHSCNSLLFRLWCNLCLHISVCHHSEVCHTPPWVREGLGDRRHHHQDLASLQDLPACFLLVSVAACYFSCYFDSFGNPFRLSTLEKCFRLMFMLFLPSIQIAVFPMLSKWKILLCCLSENCFA